MIKKDMVGTEKILLRQREGAHGVFFATVSSEDFSKFKDLGWIYDAKDSSAYREIKIKGQTRRTFLHREVAGGVFGDGKVIFCKDGNALNCIASNVEVRRIRKVSGKYVPSKPENFINYVTKHHKNSQVYNFLQIAEITSYTKKSICFTVEMDADKPVSGVQSIIQKFVEEEFGFEGRVAVIRKPIEFLDTNSALNKVAPQPALAVTPSLRSKVIDIPATETSTAVAPAAIMARIHEMSKSGNIDYLSFGVREGSKIHKFSYTCEVAPPPQSAAT